MDILSAFFLSLEESTDVSDTTQLLISIRGINKSYEVYVELLDIDSIHDTAKDIIKWDKNAINIKKLRWKNLKSTIYGVKNTW